MKKCLLLDIGINFKKEIKAMKKAVFEILGTDNLALNSLLSRARTMKAKLNILNAFKYYVTDYEANTQLNKLSIMAATNDVIFWTLIHDEIKDKELETHVLSHLKNVWITNRGNKPLDAIELATIREARIMFDYLAGSDESKSKRQYNEREQDSWFRIFKGYTKPENNTFKEYYLDDKLLSVSGLY